MNRKREPVDTPARIRPGSAWTSAIAMVLTTASVLSSLLPARRAAPVDPRVALAAE